MDILALWILYGFLGIAIFSLLFLWAVRNRQFSDQERARYLPLQGLGDDERRVSPENDAGAGDDARGKG